MATTSTIEAPSGAYFFKPFFGSSHFWTLETVKELLEAGRISRTSRILDIGCASGFIGASLKSLGFENLSAIEIDNSAREVASKHYARIESSLAAFTGETFDMVFLLDVLEHLVDPFAYLAEITTLLSPRGVVLISLPNVAHWSVRFSLLFGNFDYRERGITDFTHLQWFTRKRVRMLCRSQPKLKVEKINASIVPLELMLPSWIYENAVFKLFSRIRYSLANLLPGILAYQNLVLASKESSSASPLSSAKHL